MSTYFLIAKKSYKGLGLWGNGPKQSFKACKKIWIQKTSVFYTFKLLFIKLLVRP